MIAKRGHPVARLVAANPVRKPVDLARLRALTRSLPEQPPEQLNISDWVVIPFVLQVLPC